MKKILTILVLAAASLGQAQSGSIQLFHHNTTNSVVPNSTLYVVTLPGPDTTITKTIDVKNISATNSNTYNVKRYDIKMHGVTTTDSAHANFCFGGQCYGTGTRVGIIPLELLAGQNSASFAQYYSLDCDIIEASTIGYSLVKYTVFNENTPSDSVQFTIQYNDLTTGISKNRSTSYNMNIYPNPASGAASIRVNAPQPGSVNVTMINAIGQTVYRNETSFVEGSNNLSLDVKEYPAGVYYVILDTGNGTVTKKLTVTR